MFQTNLLRPDQLRQATLDQTSTHIGHMGRMQMNPHMIVLPSTGDYSSFAPDVQAQIDALDNDIKTSCKAVFEIGNVSGGGRTHQLTLIYMAGRSAPGQTEGNRPYCLVLDSRDAETKQAENWRFDTVRDALLFIAGKTAQPEGRVLSAACPAMPLPPATTDLQGGADIPGHGHVPLAMLSEMEKANLQSRVREFRPFTPTLTAATASTTQQSQPTSSTAVVPIDDEFDIEGMEDYRDPVWNTRIQGLQTLKREASIKSMIEFWCGHPDMAPDDAHLSTAVAFLAYQETQGRDAAGFLAQSFDVRSEQVASHVDAVAKQSKLKLEDKTQLRHQLAGWLAWSDPRTELHEPIDNAVWIERLGAYCRDLKRPQQEVLADYYRLARLAGLTHGTGKVTANDLRTHFLEPLEKMTSRHTDPFTTARDALLPDSNSPKFDSPWKAFQSLTPAQQDAELQACMRNASDAVQRRVKSGVSLLTDKSVTPKLVQRPEHRDAIDATMAFFRSTYAPHRSTLTQLVREWENRHPGQLIGDAVLALDTTETAIDNFLQLKFPNFKKNYMHNTAVKMLFSWAHISAYLDTVEDAGARMRIQTNLQNWATSGMVLWKNSQSHTHVQRDLISFIRSHDNTTWGQHVEMVRTGLETTLTPNEVQAVLDDVNGFANWVRNR
jgi:hypothetical protein